MCRQLHSFLKQFFSYKYSIKAKIIWLFWRQHPLVIIQLCFLEELFDFLKFFPWSFNVVMCFIESFKLNGKGVESDGSKGYGLEHVQFWTLHIQREVVDVVHTKGQQDRVEGKALQLEWRYTAKLGLKWMKRNRIIWLYCKWSIRIYVQWRRIWWCWLFT